MNHSMPTIKELYKIGRGPSSSHTIGPERACSMFKSCSPGADSFKVILYGSLASTGKGHGTDTVIKKVFEGYKTEIEYNDTETNLDHPNTMDIFSYKNNLQMDHWRVYSIGGGQIKIKGVFLDENKPLYRHTAFCDIAGYCKKKNIRLWEYVADTEGTDIF